MPLGSCFKRTWTRGRQAPSPRTLTAGGHAGWGTRSCVQDTVRRRGAAPAAVPPAPVRAWGRHRPCSLTGPQAHTQQKKRPHKKSYHLAHHNSQGCAGGGEVVAGATTRGREEDAHLEHHATSDGRVRHGYSVPPSPQATLCCLFESSLLSNSDGISPFSHAVLFCSVMNPKLQKRGCNFSILKRPAEQETMVFLRVFVAVATLVALCNAQSKCPSSR